MKETAHVAVDGHLSKTDVRRLGPKPGDLEAQIERFIDHYNNRRYHESLDNLTPADVYFGRGPTILAQRARIKQQTIEHRRLQHRKLAA